MKANVTDHGGIELIPESGADEFVLSRFDRPNEIRVAGFTFDNLSGSFARTCMLIVPMESTPSKSSETGKVAPRLFQMVIEYEQEPDGRWLAEVPELPGAIAYGKTPKEAVDNVLELIKAIKKESQPPPGKACTYGTVQDGYVIYDNLGKRVDPWILVKVLNKVLNKVRELSGTL